MFKKLIYFVFTLLSFAYGKEYSGYDLVDGSDNQIYKSSRITTSNAGILVRTEPSDGNTISGGSNRQRNELRLNMCNTDFPDSDKIVHYRFNLQLPDTSGLFYVNDAQFYHLFQIKIRQVKRPIFTIGFKYDNFVMYRLGKPHKSIAKWKDVAGNTVNAEIYVKGNKISATVDGVSTTYTYNGASGDMFARMGIYRSKPNPVRSTTRVQFTDFFCEVY